MDYPRNENESKAPSPWGSNGLVFELVSVLFSVIVAILWGHLSPTNMVDQNMVDMVKRGHHALAQDLKARQSVIK